MKTRNRWLWIIAALALVAAACGDSGDSTASDEASGTTTAETSTAPDDTQTTDATTDTPPDDASSFAGETLVVWDKVAASPAIDEAYQQLYDEFAAEWEVTIDRQSKTFDDLKATVLLALGQSDGPDVAVVPQGRPDMGKAVEAGLLLDLTSFGTERGWFDDFGTNILTKTMFSADGAEFGTGNVYGIAPEVEFLGWFYNKDIFAEVGVEPPTTMDEFNALLESLAAAGEVPFTAGNVEGFPILHTFMALGNANANTDYVNDLIYGRGDRSFNSAALRDGAETLASWIEADYFTPAFEGIAYGDSIGLFAGGEGAIMQTGTWIVPELDSETFGFFLTPRGDGLPPQVGATSEPYAIRIDSEAQELGLEFIDFMMSERAALVLANAGALTTRTPPADSTQSALAAEAQQAWGDITGADQVGHYLDWAAPTMFDTMVAESQLLVSGDITAEEFVEALDVTYQEYLAES